MNQKKFGDFIKQLREEKELNQGELADELHVHRTAVNKWERGKALPLNDTLILISEYFDVTIDELLAGERKTKNTSKDVQTENKVVLSLLSSERKNQKKARYFLFLACLILIIFLIYYFFTTYNTIHVYELYGEGENYSTRDSLLIISKEKIYFRIGCITKKGDTDNVDIDYVSLYLINGESTDLIFNGDPKELLIENRDNIEFFKTIKLEDSYNNMYLVIRYGDKEEKLFLTVERDFQNDGLFFSDKTAIDEAYDESSNENNNLLKLSDKFVYNEENDTYELSGKNFKIGCSIKENICDFYDKNKEIKYEYFFEYNLLKYEIMKNSRATVLKEIYLNDNMTAEETKIYEEFKTKYLDKYFSET